MTLRDILVEIQSERRANFAANTRGYKNDTVRNGYTALITRLRIVFPDFLPYEFSKSLCTCEEFMARFDINSLTDQASRESDDAVAELKCESEIQDLVAMFWYAFGQYHFFGDAEKNQLVSQALADIEVIFRKASKINDKFSDAKERHRRINHFFKKFDLIGELLTLREYYRKEDNVYGSPSMLQLNADEIKKIIEDNESIKKLAQQMQLIMDIYADLIDDERVEWYNLQWSYDAAELDGEEKYSLEISDEEAELIRVIYEIMPENNKKLFSSLRDDKWEMISKEQREKLLDCIEKLSADPNILYRYVGGLYDFDYQEKLKIIVEKLSNPVQYRIQKKSQDAINLIEKIADCAQDDSHTEFSLRLYEDVLDQVWKIVSSELLKNDAEKSDEKCQKQTAEAEVELLAQIEEADLSTKD